ncbi:UNVERIFIED_CONTAM: hypothetical protein Sangu_3194000 [Sesamum angustifolium]|uniref:DUF4283 domain-containing protein n=1 Tax=Sesamum angustifolium TaxID=2727405 RepID=A0AAW2JMG6_9LAMI
MLPSSPNSLSSLTHTTHTAPSDLHAAPTSSPVDKPDGLIEEADPGGESDILEGESTGKLSGDFDFEEFYDLATRVLNGDSDSLANLNSLKVRWEQKFNTRRNPTLKSVTGRPSTPFRPRISMLPRRVLRTGTQPAPIEDHSNLVGGSTSSEVESLGPPEPSGEHPTILVGGSMELDTSGCSSPKIGLGPQEQGPQDTEINQEGVAPHPIEGLVDSEVIYVGNVKLQAGPVDNIAGAFLQSSRKTLHFVPPTRQNGEVIIRPTKEVVDNGSKIWHTTAVGYFLGRRPYFPQLESFARANWKGLQHVSATSSGFFFFRFHTRFAMEDVIEGGPWLFLGQPIVLQCWEQGMSLRRQQHTHVPVWIRLKHLPMEYWTEEGLSTVASGIGTPLYSDGITKDCSRLDYAREDPKRVDVEYEWLPQKCSNCCSLGHVETVCPANSMKKTIAPPIKVFVKKRSVAHSEQNTEVAGAANLVCNNSRPSELGKGKAIALYNSYGALDTVSDEENDAQLSGPNQRSPTVGGS